MIYEFEQDATKNIHFANDEAHFDESIFLRLFKKFGSVCKNLDKQVT